VDLLIDREGHSLKICGFSEEAFWDRGAGNEQMAFRSFEEAVWERGFIHIRSILQTVIVSLSPRLVGPVTKAAAYYEIADLNPRRTIVYSGGPNGRGEVFDGFRPALRRIYVLGIISGTEKFYPY
jgi:hypothetical protein